MNLTVIKRILLFAILLFACRSGWGQSLSELTKDARRNVLLSTDDTSRIRTLNALGNAHMTLFVQYQHPENRDSMFMTYTRAMKIADRLPVNKSYWQSCVLYGIGEGECYAGDTVKGKQKLLKAIDFFAHHNYVNEELNCWRILSKTAEYYNVTKDRLTYLAKMESLALKSKNINVAIRTRERIIDLLGTLGHPDTVKELFINMINQYQHTNAPDLDLAYLELSAYYRYRVDFPKALYYALGAYTWMQKTNDTSDKKKSVIYGELAEVYQFLGQPANSIEWYKKTIVARRKINTTQISIYRTAGFLVQQYIKIKQGNQALNYILKLSKEFPPIGADNMANLWQIKAYCYEASGKYAQAEQAYLNMMDGYNATDTQLAIKLLAIYDIGKFYVNRGDYKKAAVYINVKNLEGNTIPQLKEFHYLLFKIDSANRNYLSAIRHLNIYKAISDSIFNATKSKQISELEIKYATDQKESDIKTLKKDRLLQNQNIKQANNIRNWTFTGICVLLIALGLLYNSYRAGRKKSSEIALKNVALNKLVVEKDNLLQEKEWLMKEIHHRVKNNLQIVMGLLQRQSSFIDNKVALTAIQNSEHRMHSIALIHQKLYQSDDYEMVNMPEYITDMIGYLKDCFGLGERIHFEKNIADIDFEINTVVPLGLILNEAITNAIKYAFSTDDYGLIQINLQQNGDHNYLLEISDNGRGLPDDLDAMKINSMGFNLMRGLSRQLGGTFSTTNNQGLGITINFNTD